MNNLPLTVYEFLVYIGTGAILLAIVSFAWSYPWIPVGQASIVTSVLWVVAAYVTGHVIAHVSGLVLEDLIVHRWFDPAGNPVLFRNRDARGWERLFRAFFRPLPRETQARVIAEAKRRNVDARGRALYLHCFAVVKQDAIAFGRMNAFINQYGFCRNMCLIGVISVGLIASHSLVTREALAPHYSGVSQVLIALALLLAIVMFYRYLKFYRLYSHELYTTYAESATVSP
jgi:hypothetical protein